MLLTPLTLGRAVFAPSLDVQINQGSFKRAGRKMLLTSDPLLDAPQSRHLLTFRAAVSLLVFFWS